MQHESFLLFVCVCVRACKKAAKAAGGALCTYGIAACVCVSRVRVDPNPNLN